MQTIYKGFRVGQSYPLKVDLIDDNRQTVRAGTRVRLICITPSVRRENVYFFNAVPDGTCDFWENYHGKGKGLPIGSRIRPGADQLGKA